MTGTNFNIRWITREWFLIGRDEMKEQLVDLRNSSNHPDMGEIVGPISVCRSQGRMVAATNIP